MCTSFLSYPLSIQVTEIRPSGYLWKGSSAHLCRPSLCREERGGLVPRTCQVGRVEQLQPFDCTCAGDSLFLSSARTLQDSSYLNALHQGSYSIIRQGMNFNWNLYSERLHAYCYFEGIRHLQNWSHVEIRVLFLQNSWVYSCCSLNTDWCLNSSPNSPLCSHCGRSRQIQGDEVGVHSRAIGSGIP